MYWELDLLKPILDDQREEGGSGRFCPYLMLDIKTDSEGVGRTWTLVTSCCQLF